LNPVDISISRDGKVHFGDRVMLINPGAKDGSCSAAALSVNISADNTTSAGVAGSSNTKPCVRNVFSIKSLDGTPNGECLKYGQHFYLCCAEGESYLSSDRASFQKCAKKSRHNEVSMVIEPSHLTAWTIVPFDPEFRMELQYSTVPANQRIIMNHVKTNNNLCLENYNLRSAFGSEKEVSTYTDLDSHRAEKESNHWMLVMNVPGDPIMPMDAPK